MLHFKDTKKPLASVCPANCWTQGQKRTRSFLFLSPSSTPKHFSLRTQRSLARAEKSKRESKKSAQSLASITHLGFASQVTSLGPLLAGHFSWSTVLCLHSHQTGHIKFQLPYVLVLKRSRCTVDA